MASIRLYSQLRCSTVLLSLFFSVTLLPSSALAQLAPTSSTADIDNPMSTYEIGQDIISPVTAQHGMVSSEQALASKIGLSMLERGGNAVDAGVAIGFALAVVLPNAGNIGGGGFIVLHQATTGKNVAIDFREMAPAQSSRDMYLDHNGNVVKGRSLYTHVASGVPGTVAGLAHTLKQYGSLPLATILAPAIELAENGFIVSPQLAQTLAAERNNLGQWEATRAIFFHDGQPLKTGERLIQKDLAQSLKLIARDGPKAFYEGSIAKKIAAEMARHNGYITQDDLKRYRVVEREPITGNYHGYQIVSMPPPSSGGTHIVQILNILSHWPLRDYGQNSAQSIHLMAEAMKLAYADRSEYLGDPDFIKVPVKALTSDGYAAELAKKIDPDHATPSSSIKPGRVAPYESNQTTQFSAADSQGNMFSATYTLNLNFGSGIIAAGTGIFMNNEMDDFSAKAGVPNAFGVTGGDANAIAPFKRPLSSMSPTIVLKDGKPFLITGSPGGSRIITTTLETILNVVDFDMNIAEATIAPRIHHQWQPDQLRVEKGISIDTIRLLEQKGQHVRVQPTMGRTQTIQIGDKVFYGFSDPRNPDGSALGF